LSTINSILDIAGYLCNVMICIYMHI